MDLDSGRYDRWIDLLPAPVVEMIVDFLEAAVRVARRINDELGELLGYYTYN